MAGVAMASVVGTLTFTMVMGLSGAVQAITARRAGEGETTQVSSGLHAGLLLGLVIGSLVAVIMIFVAPAIFGTFNLETAARDLATSYFRVVALSIPAIGANSCFRGFFNGIAKTKVYMTSLLLTVSINIFLNWVFIYGNLGAPRLDAVGAGVASAIALYCSSLFYCIFAFRYGRPFGFASQRPSSETIRAVLRLSIPASMHQFLGCLVTMVFFAIISTLGTHELAASTVVFRLTLVVALPAFGFAIAGATMVGHTLGKKEPERAKLWGWDALKMGSFTMALLGLPMWLMPRFILGFFITDDPTTLDFAVVPMIVSGASLVVNGCRNIFIQLLNGAGDQKFVLKATQSYHWFVGTPLIALVALVFAWGLNAIWFCYAINYILVSVILMLRWNSGKWAARKV